MHSKLKHCSFPRQKFSPSLSSLIVHRSSCRLPKISSPCWLEVSSPSLLHLHRRYLQTHGVSSPQQLPSRNSTRGVTMRFSVPAVFLTACRTTASGHGPAAPPQHCHEAVIMLSGRCPGDSKQAYCNRPQNDGAPAAPGQ